MQAAPTANRIFTAHEAAHLFKHLDQYMGGKYAPKTVGGWVSWVRADCIILPEPTLEWQIDISVGPELCINTPYK
eukprot:COSAG03_NODE_1012_length_5042_cov_173.962978_3_plen_75_part_00